MNRTQFCLTRIALFILFCLACTHKSFAFDNAPQPAQDPSVKVSLAQIQSYLKEQKQKQIAKNRELAISLLKEIKQAEQESNNSQRLSKSERGMQKQNASKSSNATASRNSNATANNGSVNSTGSVVSTTANSSSSSATNSTSAASSGSNHKPPPAWLSGKASQYEFYRPNSEGGGTRSGPNGGSSDDDPASREIDEYLAENDPEEDSDMVGIVLDGTQAILDIIGIFETTPIADGTNAIISIGRLDLWGAVTSIAGIVPYLGDLAKLGKLGKNAERIIKLIDLAMTNPKIAKKLNYPLEVLHDLLKNKTFDDLPESVAGPLKNLRDKLAVYFEKKGDDTIADAGKVAQAYPVIKRADLPADSEKALKEIEAGTPRHNVRNPKEFKNDGRGGTATLPETDSAGNPITYTEHTVNPRPPGGTLDGKRIITGSDGSVWYTDDHFTTPLKKVE